MITNSWKRLRDDIRFVAGYFSPASLQHVVDNRHRLIRRQYSDGNGNACFFFLLSELLPPSRRINSRESLTRYFTGGSGEPYRTRSDYRPAKYIVRLVDGDSSAAERYPGIKELPFDFLISCLQEIIAERLATPDELEPSRPKVSRQRCAVPVTARPLRRHRLIDFRIAEFPCC